MTVNAGGRPAPTAAPRGRPGGGTWTVLIADDDPDDRMFAGEAFAEARIPVGVRFVEDGVQLVDWVARRGKFDDPERHPAPDLIILDLRMPKMSGHEALVELRGLPAARDLPIIVLSTSQADEDVTRSYQLGANAHVFKPATFSGLADRLGQICRFWLDI